MRKSSDFIAQELAENDELRRIHLEDAFNSLFTDEYSVGLLMLRDVIKATCGFEVLGQAVELHPKSIMRMLTESGNPKSMGLFKIVRFLVEQEGGHIEFKIAN